MWNRETSLTPDQESAFSMKKSFGESEKTIEAQPEYQKLAAAAEANGIQASPERMQGLVEAARSFDENQQEGDNIYQGKSIWYDYDRDSLHFLPKTELQDRLKIEPLPEDMTNVMLQGIRDMQDFIIVMDAGLVPQKEYLSGETNNATANISKRLGFELGERNPNNPIALFAPTTAIHANIATLRERLFYDDIRRMEDILENRLTGDKQHV